MQDEQYIIETLGIAEWPEEKRQLTVKEATMRIGTALMDGLSEAQYAEYTAIVDDNHEVIGTWLEANAPNYQESPTFQAIAADAEADPERNRPEKIFATLAWMQANIPDVQDRVAQTLAAYKQELSL